MSVFMVRWGNTMAVKICNPIRDEIDSETCPCAIAVCCPPRRYTRRWMHAVEAISVSMLMLRKWWMPWIFDQWAHERDTFPQTDLRRSQARLQAEQRAVPQLDVERRESSWQARISDVFVRSQTEIFRLKARIVQRSVMPFPAPYTNIFSRSHLLSVFLSNLNTMGTVDELLSLRTALPFERFAYHQKVLAIQRATLLLFLSVMCTSGSYSVWLASPQRCFCELPSMSAVAALETPTNFPQMMMVVCYYPYVPPSKPKYMYPAVLRPNTHTTWAEKSRDFSIRGATRKWTWFISRGSSVTSLCMKFHDISFIRLQATVV